MFTDYSQRKNDVLEQYERFVQNVQAWKQLALKNGIPNPTESFQSSLEDAEEKVRRIRDDHFSLMVAGESKSGKSTFINAYLGVEILPMDVKQCTSAIVVIKYGETFRLHATYADDRSESVYGEDKICQFLKANAALSDDWRDIPVPSINQELIVKAGNRAGKGKPVHVPERDIQDFLNDGRVQAANIHQIPNYNNRIREYIAKHKDSWENVVVKAEVFYPFPEALRGIEIVDSPGVCARGGVSELTDDYIANADAIIFLKPISGQALESSQFNDFMSRASDKRSHKALFLVLTRAADLPKNDLDRLTLEAHKQFKQLDERHILVVDSKAKLYNHRLDWTYAIQPQLDGIRNKGELDSFTFELWYGEAGCDAQKFKDALLEKSGFSLVNDALEEFGRKAHYLTLGELLLIMDKIYIRILENAKELLGLYRQKAEDPIELAKKVASHKIELEDIKAKMYKGVDEIVRSYSGGDSETIRAAGQVKACFEDAVKKIEGEDPFLQLERLATRTIEGYVALEKKIEDSIVTKCNQHLTKLSQETDIPYTSLEPDFTPDVFRRLKEETKESATSQEPVKLGEVLKSSGFMAFLKELFRSKRSLISIYSRDDHMTTMLARTTEIVENTERSLIDNVGDFARSIGSCYNKQLKRNADNKKAEMDSVIELQQNAERIQSIITQFSEYISNTRVAQIGAAQIRGGIEKYVQ